MSVIKPNDCLQIVVVHPTEVIRQGLCALLEKCGHKIYGSYSSCEPLFSTKKSLSGILVLAHHSLCLRSGCAVRLSEQTDATVALVASSDCYHNDGFKDISAKIENGVTGFLDLNEPLPIFLSKLNEIACGSFVISKSFVSQITERNICDDGTNAAEVLNEREMGILELVAQGDTNKEIGRKLHISEHTVKSHISQILTKLDLKNRQQAAVYITKSKPGAHEVAV